MVNKKALILFSGGLDSTTVLHHAITKGYACIPLTIDYNQRHSYEIESSQKYLKNLKLKGHVTYVPARNTIFLSIASAYAEKMAIDQIFIGVNQIDYSGYPDCRPDFIDSFKTTINLGTKTGVDGKQLKINTPLINMSKKDIIKYGHDMGIDYSQTVSCYQLDNDGNACGHCDACKLRKEGFLLAGLDDPTVYKN